MSSRYTADESPETQMGQMLGGYRATQMLYVAAKLRLSDALVDGLKSLDEFANATKTHPRSL